MVRGPAKAVLLWGILGGNTMKRHFLAVAGVTLGTLMLTGCGIHSPLTAQSHSSASSPSVPISQSAPVSSSNVAKQSPSASTSSTLTVSIPNTPTGLYVIEPGHLTPQYPGMIWSYTPIGDFSTLLAQHSTTLSQGAQAPDIALFNASRQVLLAVYPISRHHRLSLVHHHNQWIVQGTLPIGRYRIEYGELIRNTATPVHWEWVRLGSAQIVSTNAQGTFKTSPMSARRVVGATNPGFAVFNQQSNALIGFLSPALSVVITHHP